VKVLRYSTCFCLPPVSIFPQIPGQIPQVRKDARWQCAFIVQLQLLSFSISFSTTTNILYTLGVFFWAQGLNGGLRGPLHSLQCQEILNSPQSVATELQRVVEGGCHSLSATHQARCGVIKRCANYLYSRSFEVPCDDQNGKAQAYHSCLCISPATKHLFKMFSLSCFRRHRLHRCVYSNQGDLKTSIECSWELANNAPST